MAADTGPFDGLFDLRILAGPDGQRLRSIIEVPQAPGLGVEVDWSDRDDIAWVTSTERLISLSKNTTQRRQPIFP